MFGLNFKRAKTITDPVFGQLVLNHRFGWEGEIFSSVAGENISVLIYRTDSNPTSEDHDIFLNFTKNFTLLLPSIKKELLKLFHPCLVEPDWEGPSIKTDEELRLMLQLELASIFPSKPMQISFGFRGDVWPDAIFTLAVDETKVVGISLDD